MTGEERALAAAVVFSGLWSGLLGMLVLVMHKMLAQMDGRGFENFIQLAAKERRSPPPALIQL